MVPIVSLFNLVSTLFFGGIGLKLYFSWRRSRNENLKYFFLTFLFLTAAMALLVLPGIILNDLAWIGLVFAGYPFFIFLSIACLIAIAFKIMGKEKLKSLFLKLMVGVALLTTAINLQNWGPAVIRLQGEFVYWEDTRGEVMNIALGIAYAVALILVLIFFVSQGLRSEDGDVRARSLFIAGGSLSFALAATANFVLGYLTAIQLTSLIATLFNLAAAFLILAGVYYKKSY